MNKVIVFTLASTLLLALVKKKRKERYVIVRLDRERHRSGVLELARHTYGGHDWIGKEFDSWFSLGYIGLGIECKETHELASLFVMRASVEDGVGNLEALRVHPNHRGQGLAHRIQAEMIKVVRERKNIDFGMITTLRYTVYDQNEASIKVATKSGMTVSYAMPYIMATDDDSTVENEFIVRKGKGSIDRFHRDVQDAIHEVIGDIRTMTNADEIVLLFRRSGITLLYQDWKPYNVTKRNVEYLLSKPNAYCMALRGGQGGVSFGHCRADHQGNICLITVYHGTTVDTLDAAQDVLNHLLRWKDICDKHCVNSVYVSYPMVAHKGLFKASIVHRETPQRELIMELVV